MSNKGILGGKVANAIDIHQEALHLSFEPKVMFILFLMKGHKKFPVVENMRSLSRPLSNGTLSGFSMGMIRCMCISSQRINTSCNKNSFNGLSETLTIDIVKINWLLGRLCVYVFNRQINLGQEYEMIARRRLIVDSRVKLDEAHYPWSIKLHTK